MKSTHDSSRLKYSSGRRGRRAVAGLRGDGLGVGSRPGGGARIRTDGILGGRRRARVMASLRRRSGRSVIAYSSRARKPCARARARARGSARTAARAARAGSTASVSRPRQASACGAPRPSAGPDRRAVGPRADLARVGGAAARAASASTRRQLTSQSWISPSRSCSSLARLARLLGVRAEARLRQLEHVAQALGGDPQVVQRPTSPGRAPPARTRAARRGGRRRSARALSASGARGVEALDRARLHAAAPRRVREPPRRARSTRQRGLAPRRRASARGRAPSLPAACSRAQARGERCRCPARRPGRRPRRAARSSARELHVGVAALAERVGQPLDVAQDGLVLGAAKHGREDLQHRAQAPLATRMSCTRSMSCGVEHAVGVLEQLLGAHGDRRAPRRRRTACRGSKPGDVVAFAISGAPPHRRRRSRTTPSRRPPRAICSGAPKASAASLEQHEIPAGSRRTRSGCSS